jgi:hypothetical protein
VGKGVGVDLYVTPLRFNLYSPILLSRVKKGLSLTLSANSTFWHIFHSIPILTALFFTLGHGPFSILETSHIEALHLTSSVCRPFDLLYSLTSRISVLTHLLSPWPVPRVLLLSI